MTIQGVRSLKLAVAAAFAAAAAILSATPTPSVQSGDQSRWSLDFRARLEQSGTRPIEVHLMGEWTSTVVATRIGEFDTQLQIGDLSFTGDAVGKASATALDDFRQRLSRPFWATYRNDGGLLAMHFLRDVSPEDQNLLQMIATELQLTQPPAHRPSWTAQERDGAGEYVALYAVPQSGSIVKRKLKYMHIDGAAGSASDALQVAIDESNVVFSLDPKGAIRAVDGTSRMHMTFLEAASGKLWAVTEIHISNLRNAKAPELIDSLARAEARVVTSPIVTHRQDATLVRAVADDRLIEDYSTDAILSAAFSKDSTDGALSDRLVALFRRRPEAPQDAVARLFKVGAKRRITNALGVAGTLDCVTALATLARNQSASEDLRVDALIAFVQMQHPSAEAMRVPSDLLDDVNPSVRSAARMMTGTMARAGRAEHPGEANAMDASLIARYRDAHETRDMCELLGALGNSAGSTTIPLIEEALRDPRVAVRAAAARALRLASGSDIDEILANVITADHDASVRSDAIFAAQFRHPLPGTLTGALIQAATADQTDYVRSNAVALLRQNPATSPEIPEALSRIAESDKNPAIRRQATDALAAISAGASAKP